MQALPHRAPRHSEMFETSSPLNTFVTLYVSEDTVVNALNEYTAFVSPCLNAMANHPAFRVGVKLIVPYAAERVKLNAVPLPPPAPTTSTFSTPAHVAPPGSAVCRKADSVAPFASHALPPPVSTGSFQQESNAIPKLATLQLATCSLCVCLSAGCQQEGERRERAADLHEANPRTESWPSAEYTCRRRDAGGAIAVARTDPISACLKPQKSYPAACENAARDRPARQRASCCLTMT